MSVAALTRRQPSADLAEAAGRDEHVILWCLSCNRSTDARAIVLIGLLGAIPFGMVIDKLCCRRENKGCGENLCVLLPFYAPTLRQWAKQYRPTPAATETYTVVHHDRGVFPFQVESVNAKGDTDRTETLTRSLAVARWHYQQLVKEARPTLGDRYRIRNASLLLEDSLRPFKVVPSPRSD